MTFYSENSLYKKNIYKYFEVEIKCYSYVQICVLLFFQYVLPFLLFSLLTVKASLGHCPATSLCGAFLLLV